MKLKINLATTMVVLGCAALPVLAGTTSHTIDTR
jgi:hypothetical protein